MKSLRVGQKNLLKRRREMIERGIPPTAGEK